MVVFEPVLKTVPLTASLALNFIERGEFGRALLSVAPLDLVLGFLVGTGSKSQTPLSLNMIGDHVIGQLPTEVLEHFQTYRAFDHHIRSHIFHRAFVSLVVFVLFAEFLVAILARQRKVAYLVAVRVLASIFKIFEFHLNLGVSEVKNY